jgi:hypothetical protein
MMEASKARTAAVKPLEKERKEIVAQWETYKKVLAARTKALSKLRKKRHHGDSPIKNGLEKLLAILGINRAAYHGGDPKWQERTTDVSRIGRYLSTVQGVAARS